MSSLTPPANRLMLAVMALVLAWTTTLPFYAPSATDPNPNDGPVEQAAWHIGRFFSGVPGTRTGEDALLLIGAAAAAVLVAGLVHVTQARVLGALLQVLGVLPLLLVLLAAIATPDGFTVHHGILAAGLSAALLANAAVRGAAVRRRVPAGPVPL